MRGCHCDNKTVYNLCEIINERRVTHSEQVSSVRVITAVPELGDGCGLVPALPDSAHFHWDLSPGQRERERERLTYRGSFIVISSWLAIITGVSPGHSRLIRAPAMVRLEMIY